MFFVYNCAKKFDKRYDMIALSLNIEPSLLGKALGAINETLAKIDPNARVEISSDVKRSALDEAIAEFERGEFVKCKNMAEYDKAVNDL